MKFEPIADSFVVRFQSKICKSKPEILIANSSGKLRPCVLNPEGKPPSGDLTIDDERTPG